MNLGPIKDQVELVTKKMSECDPASKEYETLSKRLEELTKVIQNEEERRAREDRELESIERETARHESELSERRKDRKVKLLLGGGIILTSIVGVFQDEFKVITTKGLDMANKMSKTIL